MNRRGRARMAASSSSLSHSIPEIQAGSDIVTASWFYSTSSRLYVSALQGRDGGQVSLCTWHALGRGLTFAAQAAWPAAITSLGAQRSVSTMGYDPSQIQTWPDQRVISRTYGCCSCGWCCCWAVCLFHTPWCLNKLWWHYIIFSCWWVGLSSLPLSFMFFFLSRGRHSHSIPLHNAKTNIQAVPATRLSHCNLTLPSLCLTSQGCTKEAVREQALLVG